MIYSTEAISAEVGKQYPFISNIQKLEGPCRGTLDLKWGESVLEVCGCVQEDTREMEEKLAMDSERNRESGSLEKLNESF